MVASGRQQAAGSKHARSQLQMDQSLQQLARNLNLNLDLNLNLNHDLA
jgi:hypothetical protein